MGNETRAAWDTAYINNLPDPAFLYIEKGGKKDADGKTTPRSLRHFPYKDASGAVDLPHLRNALARLPQSGLPGDVKDNVAAKAQRLLQGQNGGRSREEFRALSRVPELRDDGGPLPTMVGTLAIFNEWTEISSRSEGNFLERIAPSAFTKTIQENRDRMRVLFQHGKDPQIGDKPLGPISDIYTDEREAHYVVPLLDTSYNRDVSALLASDPPVLGSSFRFEVTREDRKRRPGKSEYNPRGLDERTVLEVRMSEFGPVTFPAYSGTKAGLRSLTDRMLLGRDERLDVEDLSTLAQMIQLGACYIGEQDDPGDEANIPKMEAIIASLTELVPYEVAEQEGDEPEDEELSDTSLVSKTDAAAEGDSNGAAPPDDRAAQHAHPIRMGRREPDPLYTGKKEVPRWRL